MRETPLVKRIVKYLNSLPECKAEKNHGSIYSKKGRPDIDVSHKGKHGVIEVKIWPKKPTRLQEKQLMEWSKAGSKTLVAYTLDQVKQQYS